ncbi:unnamed protein product [Urochloa humidicola]
MVFPRECTPHPRRRRTPILLRAADVQAVPFAPRSSPAPSATTTPPPTPLVHPPCTAAFDPLHMLASSSAGPAIGEQVHPAPGRPTEGEEPYFLGDLFAEQEDKGKGVLGPRPPINPTRSTARPPIPQARDIRMVGAASPVRRGSASPATAAAGSPRSPPSPASPAAAPAVAVNGGGGAAVAAHGRGAAADAEEEAVGDGNTVTDSEEEISVESDDLDVGAEYVEICVAEGDWARAARYAYVTMEPVTAAANPAPTIRGALLRTAAHLRYRILPSAHGVALLHFDTAIAREQAMALQPFEYHGSLVKLDRVENTDDRFIREPAWLAFVVCWNFPEEHWDDERICAVYNCMGTVREIDPECFPGLNRSCLRFVLELQHPHVPFRAGVHPPSGLGIVLRQQALRMWPRAEQFDAEGNWISFFGPPAPPANGPQAPQDGPPQMFGPAPPLAPPAQQPNQPILPGAFIGAAILYRDFLNAYPLPRLPALPIIIQLPPASPVAPPTAHTMLLLSWRAHPAQNNPPPPPPPPSPASTQNMDLPEDEEIPPPPPPARVRARRAPQQQVPVLGKRNSELLAAKDNGKFVSASDKATQLKALHNSLKLCSKPVQKIVEKKKLLTKTKKAISDADLSKLAEAVGLGKEAADALDRVLAVGAATGRELDLALAEST